MRGGRLRTVPVRGVTVARGWGVDPELASGPEEVRTPSAGSQRGALMSQHGA